MKTFLFCVGILWMASGPVWAMPLPSGMDNLQWGDPPSQDLVEAAKAVDNHLRIYEGRNVYDYVFGYVSSISYNFCDAKFTSAIINFINGDDALLEHYIQAYGQPSAVKKMPPDFVRYTWKDNNTVITLNIFDGIYTSRIKDNTDRNQCRNPGVYLITKQPQRP